MDRKSFSEVLDRALYAEKHGSAVQLARELAEPDGMTSVQINQRISRMRRDAEGAPGFDLACRVALRVPEVLEAMAREAGFVLVRRPEAAKRGDAAAAAMASGSVLSVFLEAMADGRVSQEELRAVAAAALVAQREVAGLEAEAARVAAAE